MRWHIPAYREVKFVRWIHNNKRLSAHCQLRRTPTSTSSHTSYQQWWYHFGCGRLFYVFVSNSTFLPVGVFIPDPLGLKKTTENTANGPYAGPMSILTKVWENLQVLLSWMTLFSRSTSCRPTDLTCCTGCGGLLKHINLERTIERIIVYWLFWFYGFLFCAFINNGCSDFTCWLYRGYNFRPFWTDEEQLEGLSLWWVGMRGGEGIYTAVYITSNAVVDIMTNAEKISKSWTGRNGFVLQEFKGHRRCQARVLRYLLCYIMYCT